MNTLPPKRLSPQQVMDKWSRVTELKRRMRPLVRKLMADAANAEDGHEFNRQRLELIALDPASITLGPYPWDATEKIV